MTYSHLCWAFFFFFLNLQNVQTSTVEKFPMDHESVLEKLKLKSVTLGNTFILCLWGTTYLSQGNGFKGYIGSMHLVPGGAKAPL